VSIFFNLPQQFDMLAETNKSWAQTKTVSGGKKAKIENWLPFVNSFRTQLTTLPKEMINTILVAQTQVKDGFLAARY